MALAAGIKPSTPNAVVPELFLKYFPSWFEGVAFAAIAIGALVPAAIMSIAAANLFSRNIYKEYFKRDATDAQEAQASKIASLVVKIGAVIFIIVLPTKYAIDLQLLGGVWILQTLPAIVAGLFTRWLHAWALLAGWLAGMVTGTLMATSQDFKTSVYELHIFGTSITAYEAIFALVLNILVAVGLTFVLSLLGTARGRDETSPEDYRELGEQRAAPAPAASPAGVN
jgi:SSS family solute:Na+ symporter